MGGPRVILVVGDVMDDIVVRPLEAVTAGSDTRSAISPRPGGSGANTAAWLGALGVPVRFAGRAGAADVARHAVALAACGVDARVAADAQTPTGALVVLAHDRTMFTARGANVRLEAADLPDALLDGVEHVHVSGYALFEPGPRAAVLGLVARAGLGWSVDPASAAFLREADFLAWTAGAALCLPNEDEAAVLGDGLAAAYPEVAIKRGARGATLLGASAPPRDVPAVPVEVVDLTGAGDAFAAGFLAARRAGEDPLALATETAARALAITGGRPG
ncbi:MAG: carbohydrate kinase family protein [Solirubrobacteraceae bacterium]